MGPHSGDISAWLPRCSSLARLIVYVNLLSWRSGSNIQYNLNYIQIQTLSELITIYKVTGQVEASQTSPTEARPIRTNLMSIRHMVCRKSYTSVAGL